MTGKITTTENGVDLIVEWKIDNFFSLPDRDRLLYCSHEFSFGGEDWYLEIYPNGSSESDSSGHVDLELCKCYSGRSIKQLFSLSLKTIREEKYNEQHGAKDFDDIDNWFHSFNRFIPRLELTRRKSELVPENVLTVVCTIKTPTSARNDSNSASDKCCHCNITFKADSLSSHQKQCMHRLIKCPDCLEIVMLQTWFDGHECQQKRPEGGACASGHSTSHHEKKALHDFKELLLQKENCDIVIKVKGLEFPAHRFVLKARSPVFASTFRHDMKDNVPGIVEIQDCDPSSFLDFLCFLYSGDTGMISRENVISLFTTADKYEVLDLKTECLEFLKKNITFDTFCETIALALQHSETQLIALATDFFVMNAEEILLTVKWQAFAAKNPTQSNELVMKFVRSFKY